MINKIIIKNFAIFDELELNLNDGLTVLTGETGAGKSILLEAIRASLGGKVKGTAVRSGEEKAIIEIEIEKGKKQIYCRKIIYKSGRSRVFIDDEPLKDTDFQQRVKTIADFHGQHEQQYIMDKNTHIDFLDTFANLTDDISRLESIFQKIINVKNSLKHAKEKESLSIEKRELMSFQLQEIDLITPRQGEDERLTAEYKKLKYAGKLLSKTNELNERMTEQDNSIYEELADMSNELVELSSLDKELEPQLTVLEEALNSLMESSEGLRKYALKIDHNPEQLEKVESRMHDIESLKRKYGGSLDAVLSYRSDIEIELNSFQSLKNEITKLEKKIERYRSDYEKLAIKIQKVRKNNIQKLCFKIESELAKLNIQGSQFDVRMKMVQQPNSDIKIQGEPVKYGPKGIDEVEFYLSANPGEAPKPLSDVASGGEVSRIMLAIKTIFQEIDPVATLVFDEIDAGISGAAAEKVGEALNKLSSSKQIICVTHLPQIAAKANHHLHISKIQKGGRTIVKTAYLNEEEKVMAIARLFSGVTITSGTLNSAKGLMEAAHG